ncbi:50S ribosomal protein L23 [Candidatus Sumerlaeota bacterium]|nr:50S ribosomal protein L23 [Candidatus Sumerlaeota bacterium]
MKATPYEILVRPVITEDSMSGTARTEPQYVFQVAMRANKVEIARAVELAFGVRVKSVNTLHQKGKVKTMRRRTGKRPDIKKAFVTLEAGQTIDLF